jgi:hypothetical protein
LVLTHMISLNYMSSYKQNTVMQNTQGKINISFSIQAPKLYFQLLYRTVECRTCTSICLETLVTMYGPIWGNMRHRILCQHCPFHVRGSNKAMKVYDVHYYCLCFHSAIHSYDSVVPYLIIGISSPSLLNLLVSL